MNKFYASLLTIIGLLCSFLLVAFGQQQQVSIEVAQRRSASYLLYGSHPIPIPDFYVSNPLGITAGTSSITGTAFVDNDSNGIGWVTDARLNNWKIYLSGDTNLFTLTDSLGHYSFTGLNAGTYIIYEELQTNWVLTAPPPPGFYTETVGSGTTTTGKNFGNYLNTDANTLPITLTDTLHNSRTIRWGLHPQATTCLDPQLGEESLPPMPPPGALEVRFVYPTYDSPCLELGVYLDLRQFISTAQKDTFKLRSIRQIPHSQSIGLAKI